MQSVWHGHFESIFLMDLWQLWLNIWLPMGIALGTGFRARMHPGLERRINGCMEICLFEKPSTAAHCDCEPSCSARMRTNLLENYARAWDAHNLARSSARRDQQRAQESGKAAENTTCAQHSRRTSLAGK